ncbi:hypothetical protein MAR_010762 [Mya arenaria]|uniref:Secreted protein n=1 Tax=Mya arenaria TaxID=6604 RepID=A0ABY7FW21_MYAAR|nr:hypothetical protein MAR_010762 [Mya arenaria]
MNYLICTNVLVVVVFSKCNIIRNVITLADGWGFISNKKPTPKLLPKTNVMFVENQVSCSLYALFPVCKSRIFMALYK